MEFDEAVSYAENRMRKHLTGQDDDLAIHLIFSPKPPEPDDSREEFETHLEALAYGIERNRKLTPENSEWLVKYLRGELALPKKRAGRPRRNYRKDLAIAECVDALESKGLFATRNSEPNNRNRSESACDAVAHAMVKLRETPQSFDEIKKIYLAMKKLDEEFDYQDAEMDLHQGVGGKTEIKPT